jgi:hypothetical protein
VEDEGDEPVSEKANEELLLEKAASSTARSSSRKLVKILPKPATPADPERCTSQLSVDKKIKTSFVNLKTNHQAANSQSRCGPGSNGLPWWRNAKAVEEKGAIEVVAEKKKEREFASKRWEVSQSNVRSAIENLSLKRIPYLASLVESRQRRRSRTTRKEGVEVFGTKLSS